MLVYLLTDPRNPLKGYVGQTRLTASRRLGDHLKAAQYGSQLPVHRWIRKLQREGVAPRVEVLRVLDSAEECNRVERELIAKYRARPEMKLYNINDGGHGDHGEQWKKRVTASTTTPEYRKAASRRSQAMWDGTSPEKKRERLAKAHTPESRKARSEKKTLRNADPAVRKYLSEKSAAYYRTPEGRALQSARSTASNARPDVKAKLAIGTARAWSDPGHKAARSAAMRAAAARPEEKARKSESMKRIWAERRARKGAVPNR